MGASVHADLRARVRAALRAAAERTRGPLVRAALRAAAERDVAVRLRDAVRAWRASAECEAAAWPSRLSALRTARERFVEVFLPRRRRAAFALLRVCADACPAFGARRFTPVRRAFDNPMAMACLVERAPCFPSRTWCISSRTNSPACVDAAFP